MFEFSDTCTDTENAAYDAGGSHPEGIILAVRPMTRLQRRMAALGVAVLVALGVWAAWFRPMPESPGQVGLAEPVVQVGESGAGEAVAQKQHVPVGQGRQ